MSNELLRLFRPNPSIERGLVRELVQMRKTRELIEMLENAAEANGRVAGANQDHVERRRARLLRHLDIEP